MTLQSGRCLNFRDVISSLGHSDFGSRRRDNKRESDFLGHSLRSWSPLFGTFRIAGPFGVKEAWDVRNIIGTLCGLRSLGHLIWDICQRVLGRFRDIEVCDNFFGTFEIVWDKRLKFRTSSALSGVLWVLSL